MPPRAGETARLCSVWAVVGTNGWRVTAQSGQTALRTSPAKAKPRRRKRKMQAVIALRLRLQLILLGSRNRAQRQTNPIPRRLLRRRWIGYQATTATVSQAQTR